jgi:hypothetical protein
MEDNSYIIELFGVKLNCLFDNLFLNTMTSNDREATHGRNNFVSFLSNLTSLTIGQFSEIAIRNFGEREFKTFIKSFVFDDYGYSVESNGLAFDFGKEIALNLLKNESRKPYENFILLLLISTPTIAYNYLLAIDAERDFLLNSSELKKMAMNSAILNFFNSVNKRFFYNCFYKSNENNADLTKSLLYLNLDKLDVKVLAGKYSISKSILDPDYELRS